METVRKLTDLDPTDRSLVERLFGKKLDRPERAVVILKTIDEPAPAVAASDPAESDNGMLPAWLDVLAGMTDEELAEFDAALKEPVRLARSE